MIELVALFGTGDAYLVAALAEAVAAHHRDEVTLLLKQQHAGVMGLFPGVAWRVDPDLVRDAEQSLALRQMPNRIGPGARVFVHPQFVNSGVRIDHFATRPRVTHADITRALLGLPLDTVLRRGRPPEVASITGRALIIPEARSWPNTAPEFWKLLEERLEADRWDVAWNEARWSLAELLDHCARAEWVIGPQCGVMALLCHAGFPCRKTLVTPALPPEGLHGFPVRSTFPYCRTETFAGERYDVDEFEVCAGGETEMAEQVARSSPSDRVAPVLSIDVAMSPGELLDRLSIAGIRCEQAPIRGLREYLRLEETARPVLGSAEIRDLYLKLYAVNRDAWRHNEIMVRAALGDGGGYGHHVASMQLNRERTRLKTAINDACGAIPEARKSYYEPGC